MEAENATLIDYDTLKPRTVPRLTVVQTLKGNVEKAREVGAETGRDVVVWDTLSYAAGPDGAMVSMIPERYVFDAHSQEPSTRAANTSTAPRCAATASSSNGRSSSRNATTATST